jgi:hypothetical protein
MSPEEKLLLEDVINKIASVNNKNGSREVFFTYEGIKFALRVFFKNHVLYDATIGSDNVKIFDVNFIEKLTVDSLHDCINRLCVKDIIS